MRKAIVAGVGGAGSVLVLGIVGFWTLVRRGGKNLPTYPYQQGEIVVHATFGTCRIEAITSDFPAANPEYKVFYWETGYIGDAKHSQLSRLIRN